MLRASWGCDFALREACGQASEQVSATAPGTLSTRSLGAAGGRQPKGGIGGSEERHKESRLASGGKEMRDKERGKQRDEETEEE